MLRPVAQAAWSWSSTATTAWAEVVRIDVRRRDDAGTHERIIARVHFATDPAPAGQPRHRGSGPRAAERRRPGGVLGRPAVLPTQGRRARARHRVPGGREPRARSGAGPDDGRRPAQPGARVVEHGRRLSAGPRLHRGVPGLAVRRHARARPHLPGARRSGGRARSRQRDHRRGRAREPPASRCRIARRIRRDPAPRSPTGGGWKTPARPSPPRRGVSTATAAWSWSTGPCASGLYEAVYSAHGSPVAGLGLAAVRDFASYLKHGGRDHHAAGIPGHRAADHRLRLLAERTIPARVRARRLQRRRARPRRVRRAVHRLGRRRRRQLQPPLRHARTGRQLRAVDPAPGGRSTLYRRRPAGPRAARQASCRASSTRSPRRSTGRARDR